MDAVLDQTERTPADVEAAAQAAGLHSQHPVVQLLQFSPDMSQCDDIKLLELPPTVLHALEQGQRSDIKVNLLHSHEKLAALWLSIMHRVR